MIIEVEENSSHDLVVCMNFEVYQANNQKFNAWVEVAKYLINESPTTNQAFFRENAWKYII